jgi:lysozyme
MPILLYCMAAIERVTEPGPMSLRAVKRVSIALAAIIAGAFVAVHVIYPWLEPAAFQYPLGGVDISHHQGDIDWEALKADGVDFAYIKASEGENFNDPRFSRNWFAAEQAGMLRGAYHFFARCRGGEAQARNFIRVVPRDARALPPAIDAEQMGPCRDGRGVEDVAAEIATFLKLVHAHYGKRPVIYTTRQFHDAHLAGKFAKERFWIRSLILAPRIRREQWVFWQYHNRGRRRGIAGPVDLNVFRGTRVELEALR